MRTVILRSAADATEWREAARALLLASVPPEQIDWRNGAQASLFDADPPPVEAPAHTRQILVSRAFLDLMDTVICHSDDERFSLLYRLLWRLQTHRHLLQIPSDPDMVALHRMEKSVRRDYHKMTAFVRFREASAASPQSERRRFLAWFEPDHHIVARTAPFFAKRFADMDWLILTPKGSAAFEGGRLTVSEAAAEKPELSDSTDELWTTYYSAIFNPARVKVKAMQSEMPKKYWKNLPEAALIPALLAEAPARVAAMAEQQFQTPPTFHTRLTERMEAAAIPAPSGDSFEALRQSVLACTRCALHCKATQSVFGEGPRQADLMIIGEQPGDQEDLAGRPFVGPAGQLLNASLKSAGIDRSTAYITNAVKHFKFTLQGKRRLHASPVANEIAQCRDWLMQEIDLVQPRLIITLGATALRALLGKEARLNTLRSQILSLPDGRALAVNVHPSYLLRIPDAARAEDEKKRFNDDLAQAQNYLKKMPAEFGHHIQNSLIKDDLFPNQM